ncbi:carbamoyl phosphate synthase small subunit [Ameyamaea chiangmaiensis NBRC 103196]|uniref:Carbamoyl phosphate synthase small chain n=1 Tax=Ameyamaea chiangmaiensis TaxID=442969 RepID=A0A850PFX6_9PROT|nr:glutamine-hydrolyzing carbamoyl-phosphate synthase small subunit [Ameyamaea chiangmaiensis]MBS4075391.1 glutamine-hydrolyzing carbamoyl-phosphate synthase small subunit [Ameyamaea chiangmaiensis]NVN41136.1 glutamine-hydrolyzing carbamoyl-phosphate synthase small subunit [Ameyamaea chiangmaiensis]GBQ69921.1 carbamoyl phosphate synthase small subunit [Ameyamaea chiangmaiensis NBRC 103196]
MSQTVETIIEKAGGLDRVAELTGVGLEAIRKWRQTRAIPTRHWPILMREAGLDMAAFHTAPSQAETASMNQPAPDTVPEGATAVLVLADGTVLWGRGFGAHTTAAGRDGLNVGEICFSTGLTGYQETLTDPSFAGQIITFTFPHIGNVGTNSLDDEARGVAARGLVVRQDVTQPANWRATAALDAWLKARAIPGISGVDTRALTLRIRDGGPQSAVLAFPADGRFDIGALTAQARAWAGLDGMDLAREVTCDKAYGWSEGTWTWPEGRQDGPMKRRRVVAIDYGAKHNILRCLTAVGCDVTVVPATATADEILGYDPEGIFLSNGPGDPAATGVYAVPTIRALLDRGLPVFGICLGHQLLALTLGARTYKLARGHRGANQPVKDLSTGRVEITSQNHGFAVDEASLPNGVRVTHTSLFDGSNEGIASETLPAFSVQYHPEASPGPSDSFHLFERFVALMDRVHAGDSQPVSGLVPSA